MGVEWGHVKNTMNNKQGLQVHLMFSFSQIDKNPYNFDDFLWYALGTYRKYLLPGNTDLKVKVIKMLEVF